MVLLLVTGVQLFSWTYAELQAYHDKDAPSIVWEVVGQMLSKVEQT